jgi:hypothetical protein
LELALLKVLLLLAVACVSACSPDKPSVVLPAQAKVGSWVPTDAFNPDVQEAARFAVQTFAVQNKARVLFKEVSLARQQVVAGTQFDLNLEVTLEGAARNSKAVVWRQLDGTYKLQAWDWLD